MTPVRYLLDLAASIRALRLDGRYVSEEDYQRLLVRHLQLILEMKERKRKAAPRPFDVAPTNLPASTLCSLN